MITWILQSSLCWLIFLIIYRIFLQKETFFRFNRYYLLGTLLLGGIIPLLRLLWEQWAFQEKDLPVITAFQGTARILDLQFNSPTGLNAIDWLAWMSLIYWIGVLVSFGLLVRECYGILRLIRTCPKQQKGGFIQVTTDFEHLPFSFLHYIFISDKVKFKDRELNRILRHETSHVTDRHTMDVLIVELIAVMAWWSPMVYWYKKSIRNTHEYLADALVTLSEDKNSYGRLLIDHSQRGLHMALANHFIYSQLKNRINMMMKLRSRPIQAWKYTLIVPILALLGILFAYKSDVIQIPQPENLPMNVVNSFNDSIYNEVDQMPRFPGCNHLRSTEERSNCSLQNLVAYLSKSVRYPGNARQSGIQGVALISFVVNTDGTLTQFELLKDPGQGTGTEALRVAKAMNELEEKWTPGQLNGHPVRVKMTLPIQFKLAESAALEQVPEKLKFSGLALYVLNGDKVSADEIENILPDQIQAINILKDEKAIEKYGPEGKFGVIEIETKPNYILNGEESSKEIMDQIPPDQIATVDVVKYGKKGTANVSVWTKDAIAPELKEKIVKMIGDEKQMLILDGNPTRLESIVSLGYKIKSMHQVGPDESIVKYGQEGKFGAVEFLTTEDKTERKIFQEVDELPRFPGCEQLATYAEKQACANEKLIQYLYTRLQYPKSAKDQAIEGRVVVSFVVTEDGNLFDVKLVKDIGGGCGTEAMRVVQTMIDMEQKWIPAKKNGQSVAAEFKLPLQFKLQTNIKPANTTIASEKVTRVENAPVKLVPNPSSQQVEVFWNKSGAVQLEIFDISGKLMQKGKWAEFNGSQIVDIKLLSPGTYIVKLIQGAVSQEQKLIIR